MSCRLKSYEQPLPGNYPYHQTDGIDRKFPAQPTPEYQAQVVSAFRKGNGLSRSSLKECLEDVDRYQCQRLGNNPVYCTCSEAQANVLALNASSPIITPCKGCGVVVS